MLNILALPACLVLGVVFGLKEDFVWMGLMAAGAIFMLVRIQGRMVWAALAALIMGVTLLLNDFIPMSIVFLLAMVVLGYMAIPARQPIRT